MLAASIHHIIASCQLSIHHYETVQGGDINRAYCLHGNDAKYFLKVNDAQQYPAMFEKEASGLYALQVSGGVMVPEVIKYGEVLEEQYLLLEWIETGLPKRNFWQNFGTVLALQHQKKQPFFGWNEDNFIGSLVQYNQPNDSWALFYEECRIMPLVKILVYKGCFSQRDRLSAEMFCKKLGQIFPDEPPALLHGDLWSGNFKIAETGYAAIFDPAIYNGHREMDMGMTALFGGFHPQFYDAYNEAYPLEKDWQQRLPVVQLYPLLVHAVLFGSPYVQRSAEILKRWAG